MVITTLTFGGAETQVVRLAIELRSRGWVVAIACLVEPTAFVDQLNEAGINVHSLDMSRGVPDPRAILKLRRLICMFKPDIVHSHMVHANLLARITHLVTPIKVLISTAHNTRETSERGGPTWHKELLYRLTDCLADKTTIICSAARDRYVRIGAVPPHKLAMIPNGVDTSRFVASKDSRDAARKSLGVTSEFVWLSVGRLVKQKDYSLLIRAIHLLPKDGWILLIAGRGPLLPELTAECRRLRVEERIRFLGAREDIRDLYSAADAFVMSSGLEGLSAALLEASSVGLPSVVTNVGGNAEIVLNGSTGYVVESGNPNQLACAMRSMMDASPQQRLTFGRAARQHCLANYDFKAVVEKWLALYQSFFPASPAGQSSRISHFRALMEGDRPAPR
jgi:glycosyltransferase involved in cell wall biosynthesis